jgi:DNA-binding transcriptional regulator YiaG
MPYQIKIRHDNVLHTVDIPALTVPRCGNCGELLFDNDADDQMSAALRAQLHLLSPEQIHSNRTSLGLSREELSARIGMPPDTVEELEERLRIQSRALDNLLRVFFAVPQARTALDDAKGSPEFGLAVAGDAVQLSHVSQ